MMEFNSLETYYCWGKTETQPGKTKREYLMLKMDKSDAIE